MTFSRVSESLVPIVLVFVLVLDGFRFDDDDEHEHEKFGEDGGSAAV